MVLKSGMKTNIPREVYNNTHYDYANEVDNPG